jgi:hypothetical protein
MSLPAVKWGDVKRYFNSKPEYQIHFQGGDAIITKKSDAGGIGSGKIVLIGHNYCQKHTKELSPAYLKKIERTYGITREDILNS